MFSDSQDLFNPTRLFLESFLVLAIALTGIGFLSSVESIPSQQPVVSASSR